MQCEIKNYAKHLTNIQSYQKLEVNIRLAYIEHYNVTQNLLHHKQDTQHSAIIVSRCAAIKIHIRVRN
jgi:hypothetical protein